MLCKDKWLIPKLEPCCKTNNELHKSQDNFIHASVFIKKKKNVIAIQAETINSFKKIQEIPLKSWCWGNSSKGLDFNNGVLIKLFLGEKIIRNSCLL